MTVSIGCPSLYRCDRSDVRMCRRLTCQGGTQRSPRGRPTRCTAIHITPVADASAPPLSAGTMAAIRVGQRGQVDAPVGGIPSAPGWSSIVWERTGFIRSGRDDTIFGLALGKGCVMKDFISSVTIKQVSALQKLTTEHTEYTERVRFMNKFLAIGCMEEKCSQPSVQ